MKTKRIVTVGGGTGSFTLLSGLKKYPFHLSAVVSMADDGGSTGILRDELGVLPPGDVRQCLVALSESSKELRELMNYRFEDGSLKGHSFGNLFLSALEKINGDFAQGVEEAMKILKVEGQVIPVTGQNIKLILDLSDGSRLEGEDQINRSDIQRIGVKKVHFVTNVLASEKALKSVAHADAILIGPGNHYCSILPNLAVADFAEGIRKSRAKVIYISNLTNKKGHTIGWDVDDYVDSVEKYIGKGRIDHVLFNVRKPQRETIERYEKSEGKNSLVHFVASHSPSRKYKLVKARVASSKIPDSSPSDALASSRALIRHDPVLLARTISLLLELEENRSVICDII